MHESFQLVVFSLDEQKYALRLAVVERVVRMVAVTPLPGAPEHVMGIINLQGQIIPVINMRRILDLPEREIRLNDQLIIVHSTRRTFALYVDSVIGNTEKRQEEITKIETVYNGIQYIEGIIKFEDGLTLIHNPEQFLSDDEVVRLQKMIQSQPEKPVSEIKTSEISKPKIAKRKLRPPRK